MDEFDITALDIVNVVNKLKDKISRTPEDIPTFVIKRILSTILYPLLYIYNHSLKTGCIPSQWKKAIVVPVYKKGKRNKACNYRPISLTSSFCRILESVIFNKVWVHLLNNDLITESQFGFVPNRSSCFQLLSCLHKWFLNLFRNIPTDVIYSDISKAFDSVSHPKLLSILRQYGLNETIVSWIKNFLSDRHQQVFLNDVLSSLLQVHSGVPQGSIVGPLLFVICINDIVKCIESTSSTGGIKLFADDAKLYSSDPAELQCSINQMQAWLLEHQLNWAPLKSFLLSIKKSNNITPPNTFFINGIQISSTFLIKDLGIMITPDLKWSQHVSYIYNQASVRSYQILKGFDTRVLSTLVKLFITYVRPKLEYNSSLWSPYLEKDKQKIERVQKLYTKRICCRCNIKNSGYKDRLKKLNLQPLEERRIMFDLISFYKIINNLSTLKFDDYFKYRSIPYNCRGNPIKIDTIDDFKSQQWRNTFFARVPKYWNFLPQEIASCSNLGNFKQKLKSLDLSVLT